MAEVPALLSVWQHYTGNLYCVMHIANENSSPERAVKYPPTVVYMNVHTHVVYARPLSRWHASMTLTTKTIDDFEETPNG